MLIDPHFTPVSGSSSWWIESSFELDSSHQPLTFSVASRLASLFVEWCTKKGQVKITVEMIAEVVDVLVNNLNVIRTSSRNYLPH